MRGVLISKSGYGGAAAGGYGGGGGGGSGGGGGYGGEHGVVGYGEILLEIGICCLVLGSSDSPWWFWYSLLMCFVMLFSLFYLYILV